MSSLILLNETSKICYSDRVEGYHLEKKAYLSETDLARTMLNKLDHVRQLSGADLMS